jgi:type I restriction enzyme S subunit
MSHKLPKGWVKTTLGEITVPSRARVLPSEAPQLPYVGMEHVESATMRLLGHGKAADLKSSAMRFKEGDVLYGKMRPYLNKVWVARFDGVCSAEFLVFPKTAGLNGQLLAFRLNAPDFVNFANNQVSGDRPRIAFQKLAKFPYLLAPESEQDRIVAKLQPLLSRIASGESAARRALVRLERYRAAVLHAAATGSLTRDWRKSNKPRETGRQLLKQLLTERRACWEESELERLQSTKHSLRDEKWKNRYTEPVAPKTSDLRQAPATWAWASVEQLNPADRPCEYGVLQPGPHVPRGVLLVRVGDIHDGEVSLDRMKRIAPRIAAAYKRTTLQGGELLISLVGAIGRTAVAPKALAGANSARAVGVVPLSPKVNAAWVELWFRSPDKLNEMIGKAHEVARKTLNLEDVRSAAVPLPPIEEQAEIVREVRKRFAASDRLETTLHQQLARAQSTRQSLLDEAFSGRLVLQDPKDESAAVLLARIRIAREAEAKKPRSKRMPQPKSITAHSLEELDSMIKRLGKSSTPERLLLLSGLGDDVEKFFDLLRSGRDNGTLIVPTGKSAAIRRVKNAH